MEINQINDVIIQAVLDEMVKAESDEEAIEIIRKGYLEIHDDGFAKAKGILEQFLFRYYEIVYLYMENIIEDFDKKAYVTEDSCYKEYWKKLCEKQNTETAEMLYDLGVHEVRNKDLYKAGVFFSQAAALGDSDGQYNFGITVTNGEGVTADPLKGSFWYWEASKHGNPKAMMNLAIAYRNGTGVHENGVQMLYWYAKSASTLKNPVAVYNLGLSLKHEEVVEGMGKIGQILIDSSDYMDSEEVQRFVYETSCQIMGALEKLVYNAN
ncbi:MAG: sel1 repeat family protein [Lachnospiraceae bacterium]|nr:sel1 repeat family protein [Lachnospiraceae bacterium]